MERYLRTGEKRIIGIGREVIGLKKDGTVFPLHLSVSSFEVDRTVYFTGIIHDLTERTQHEACTDCAIRYQRRRPGLIVFRAAAR